jgi:GDPmannose 4,6-dehydratase
MSARRALVTGITGQDGSYLVERLLEGGRHVVGLLRPPADRPLGPLEAIRGDIDVVAADLRDPRGLGDAIRAARPDEVFHLAAPTFVPASWEDPAATIAEIALAGAIALRAAAEAGARVLVPASPEIFGAAPESPQREDTPKHPRSPYGVAKLAIHELVGVLREGDGAHASSAITYNHESPRRPERFVTRKITRAAAAISLGREREVTLGDLDARRDWSHARDIVEGMVLAVEHEQGGDYVLASGVARTVRELADTAFAVVGLRAADHVRVDERLVRGAEPTVLAGDATRARDVLGWAPRVDFADLVREMVEADLAALRAA